MSNDRDKEKHGKRIMRDENAIRKQVKIAKVFGLPVTEAHRFAKHHATNCGIPGCVMCANPRKTFKEKTIQEKKFEQRELYDET
jgi:hypothetical protein